MPASTKTFAFSTCPFDWVQLDALFAAKVCEDALCKVCPVVQETISHDDLVEELDG
jgi:hypothetical protein